MLKLSLSKENASLDKWGNKRDAIKASDFCDIEIVFA